MTDYPFQSSHDHDLAALEARVNRRRHRYTQPFWRKASAYAVAWPVNQQPSTVLKRLPRRYVLHALVLVVLPLATGLMQIYRAPVPVAPQALQPESGIDLNWPVAPLVLDSDGDVIDSLAFAEIDALAESGFDPNLLTVRPVPATVLAENANLRGGPGTNYDKVGDLPNGASLTLLSRSGEWYKAQREDGSIVWVVAELLAMNATAASLLPEATDIPAPPPPKVATVIEANLNLRDGPDTKYVGMIKLGSDAQLDLLARYNDWYQVQTADGAVGWVRSDFLTIAPGVTERVEVVTQIPDPNPKLVGMIREQGVNVREGPGTGYRKVAQVATGVELELLGRYDDWFKVRTTAGAIGWISNELLQISDYIGRRVQLTRDFPALPKPQVAVAASAKQAPQTVKAAPAPAKAAGSVVEYAMQFVGTPYVFGAGGPNAFDCSGFTRYVYKQYGLNLPHSSAGQYSTAYGSVISSKDQLAPGDLVFFVNTYKKGISHVGIYIGGGNVVQAMSPALGLRVANINSAYWSKHYYSAIRPG